MLKNLVFYGLPGQIPCLAFTLRYRCRVLR